MIIRIIKGQKIAKIKGYIQCFENKNFRIVSIKSVLVINNTYLCGRFKHVLNALLL